MNSSYYPARHQRRHRRGADFAGARPGSRLRAGRRTDQNRLQHGADRAAGGKRQAGAAWRPDLARTGQRQRRPARPPGPAGQLRRPVQSGDRSGNLHQAARRRQSRPHRLRLCDQYGGAGHSDRHAAEQGLHRPVRARRQQRVPLSEILLDAAVRPDAERILHRRLLPDRGGAKSQAADHRHRGRGCRLLAQCRRWRPGQREKVRPQDGLRQDLPAQHDRLLADRARHPGRQSRISL